MLLHADESMIILKLTVYSVAEVRILPIAYPYLFLFAALSWPPHCEARDRFQARRGF